VTLAPPGVENGGGRGTHVQGLQPHAFLPEWPSRLPPLQQHRQQGRHCRGGCPRQQGLASVKRLQSVHIICIASQVAYVAALQVCSRTSSRPAEAAERAERRPTARRRWQRAAGVSVCGWARQARVAAVREIGTRSAQNTASAAKPSSQFAILTSNHQVIMHDASCDNCAILRGVGCCPTLAPHRNSRLSTLVGFVIPHLPPFYNLHRIPWHLRPRLLTFRRARLAPAPALAQVRPVCL